MNVLRKLFSVGTGKVRAFSCNNGVGARDLVATLDGLLYAKDETLFTTAVRLVNELVLIKDAREFLFCFLFVCRYCFYTVLWCCSLQMHLIAS